MRKMRLARAISQYLPLFTYLIVETTATTANCITLSQFQQISGFSDTCTTAYNTPLTQCTQSDFENGRSCSMSCVAMLEEVQALLATACRGTKAFPNTLIGMFFQGGGVQTLCPNVQESGGSTGGAGGNAGGNTGANNGGNNGGTNGGGQNSQTSVAVSASQAPSRPSTSSTKAEASTAQQTTQTQPLVASSQTSLLISTVSTTAPAAQPTINSDATLTQTGFAGLKSSTAQSSSTSSSSSSSSAQPSSSAQQDRNNNGNSGGSGGTPFDITASGRKLAVTPSMLAFIIGISALLYLV